MEQGKIYAEQGILQPEQGIKLPQLNLRCGCRERRMLPSRKHARQGESSAIEGQHACLWDRGLPARICRVGKGCLSHLPAKLPRTSGAPASSRQPAGRIVPRRIRDWLYDRIARNRYRLFGKRATCLVPSPEVAARFMG